MSDDFLVTHICAECNHIWLYPNVFDHACPGCGTTREPVSVDVLAGRREKRASGEDLAPLVLAPDKGTPMHTQFTEGVRMIRDLIGDMQAQAQRLTDWGGELEARSPTERDSIVQAAYGAAKEARNQYARLQVAERKISALFILGDDAESFAGVKAVDATVDRDGNFVLNEPREDVQKYYSNLAPPPDVYAVPKVPDVPPNTLTEGSPCPNCVGTLRRMPTPIYLTCSKCGTVFVEGDAQPLKRQVDSSSFTGHLIQTGPRDWRGADADTAIPERRHGMSNDTPMMFDPKRMKWEDD